MDGFRLLVADPPWRFGDSLPGKKRGASKHYRCMELWEIQRFPLPGLAADCVLLLWRVAAMQQEAIDVCRAWGFTPKSEIVWRKLSASGKPHFGMGRTVRASHESCVVATRGRWRPKSRSVRSVFEAQVGRHSEKPDAFYSLAEELSEGPYAEIFARRDRPGWTCFGDELEAA